MKTSWQVLGYVSHENCHDKMLMFYGVLIFMHEERFHGNFTHHGKCMKMSLSHDFMGLVWFRGSCVMKTCLYEIPWVACSITWTLLTQCGLSIMHDFILGFHQVRHYSLLAYDLYRAVPSAVRCLVLWFTYILYHIQLFLVRVSRHPVLSCSYWFHQFMQLIGWKEAASQTGYAAKSETLLQYLSHTVSKTKPDQWVE